MKLLAVDTSTEACSAALLIDGDIEQRYQLAPREHSHLILTMVHELLSQASLTVADLDALAFGRGPGSFMGIRIAAGVIQGIGFAHALPVVPVSTLAAMARVAMAAGDTGHVLTAIDARMQEVYWGAYVADAERGVRLVGEERVLSPALAPVPDSGKWLAAGTGWASYADSLEARFAGRVSDTLTQCFPTASAIAELAQYEFARGNTVTVAEAVPVYLRDNVAKKAAGRD